ncbi:hypothetical protein [Nostoc sp.]|uniref:hypothetical protein n=1 Tax=Nostoc sp. TaxID=1180 RepID=UPI003FA5BF28
MGAKHLGYKGNPGLQQQKHIARTLIKEIGKELFPLLSPKSFKPLKLCKGIYPPSDYNLIHTTANSIS